MSGAVPPLGEVEGQRAAVPPLGEVETWLAAREAAAGGVRPGAERRVIWAAGPARTGWSVVYVHGFSASRREVSPYPERVAAALGANFYGARLAGHGQDGPAMDGATLGAWRADVAEAFAVGRALGERALVVACSTGGTLVALALAGGERAAGAVLLSPNFGLAVRRLQAVLEAPGAATWGPWIVRSRQSPPAANLGSGIWSGGYSARAYAPMAASVRAARRADFEAIGVPALFAFADGDRVVDARLALAVMRRWGAPVERVALAPGPGDDPMAHVMAGDALSPGQTDALVARTVAWARGLKAG